MTTGITYDDIYQLTHKLKRARSLDHIHLHCAKFCELTGFDHFSYRASIPTALTRPDIIEVTNYPRAWLKLYEKEDLIRIDPTLLHAEQCLTPIEWDDMLVTYYDHTNIREYTRRAKRHGLVNGITFPLRGNVGGTSMLSLVTRNGGPIPLEKSNPALTFGSLFASHVHDAVLRIFDQGLLPLKKKRLSMRECEVLLWVAEGKTTWEVAQILKIGERTVSYHLENIIAKLEVKNRQQAVARAMMMSFITHRVNWDPRRRRHRLSRTRELMQERKGRGRKESAQKAQATRSKKRSVQATRGKKRAAHVVQAIP